MGEDLIAGDGGALLSHDHQQGPLVPFGVRQADGGGLLHAGAAKRNVLDLDRRDPFAARLDHVLGAVCDVHVAILIDGGDVARVEPAIGIEGGDAFALEIAFRPRPGPSP